MNEIDRIDFSKLEKINCVEHISPESEQPDKIETAKFHDFNIYYRDKSKGLEYRYQTDYKHKKECENNG